MTSRKLVKGRQIIPIWLTFSPSLTLTSAGHNLAFERLLCETA